MKLMLLSFSIALLLALAVNPHSRDRANISQQPTAPLVNVLEVPDRVHSIAFSPDGKLLAAGYGWSGGGIRVWNFADKTIIANLADGKEDDDLVCTAVAFSNDGKYLAGVNWHGDVTLWEVGKWKSPKRLLTGQKGAKTLSFSADSRQLAVATESQVILYDIRVSKQKVLVKSNKPENEIVSAKFEKTFLIVFRVNSIEIWDVGSTRIINKLSPAGGGFFGEVTSDDEYLISGGGAVYGDKQVDIFNSRSGKKIQTLSKFRDGLFAAAASHSGEWLALSGGDYGSGGSLSLWNLKDAKQVGFLSYGDMPMQALAFSPDDSVLAAGSDNGKVLLYAPEEIRGPEIKKQDYSLCGEISEDKVGSYIVPLSKVPRPMEKNFDWAWKTEIVGPDVSNLARLPVSLNDWNLVTDVTGSKIRINGYQKLISSENPLPSISDDYIVFGHVTNPGWDEGSIVKIYSDGSFVASNNGRGKCLANGSLASLHTDFKTVKQRLINEGLLSIPKQPSTLDTDHYGTTFIEIVIDGRTELRTDADDMMKLLSSGGRSAKRDAFDKLYTKEKAFVESLLKAGGNK